MSKKSWQEPPVVAAETCVSCGLCVRDCVALVLELEGGKARAVRPDWCIGCGHCGAVCPTGAVRHEPTASEERAPLGAFPAVAPEELDLLIRERRSVRGYRKEPVPREVVERLLETARYTPTGSNRQNVRYIAIDNPDELARIRDQVAGFYRRLFRRMEKPASRLVLRLVAGRRSLERLEKYRPMLDEVDRRMAQGDDRLLFGAPVLVLAHGESWDSCSAFNCSAALWTASLAAHCQGLGCCFNGFVEGALRHSKKLRASLGIPRRHHCFAAMTLGYPRETYRRLVEREPAEVAWR